MNNHKQRLQDGIFIGNLTDKSNLSNPIARRLVSGFDASLFGALDKLNPQSLHEVGCGEGRLTRLIRNRYNIDVLATDFSKAIIHENLEGDKEMIEFKHLSIYDLNPAEHKREIIVCCEVLEHLENPLLGLKALRILNAQKYILSVPREPIWRILNMIRFKYWRDLGNTPGHLNHWGVKNFKAFLSDNGIRVIEQLNPFPWIMVVAEPN
ncbi:MAG: class I SAM-dependent methyltransferase [Verrucomicrobia bacterium]|nr:class I SAM-dependent methyltransferase [Verrucomicrobiota bacterium]